MSIVEPAGRLSRRSFLVAGLALATAVVAGCGVIPGLVVPDPNQSIYRTQARPEQPLAEEAFALTGTALETRLRLVVGDAVVRPVRDGAGNFYLLEIPSVDVPEIGSLVLTTGRVSIARLPADAAVDEAVPAGSEVIVDDLRVPEESVRIEDTDTGLTLEFTLVGADSEAVAAATEVPGGALGIVVDGVVRFVAIVHAPIPDGRVSIVNADRPAMLSAIGAILASGPLATELSADEDGQILFTD